MPETPPAVETVVARRKPGPPLPDRWQERFLEKLREHGTYAKSAERVGISVKTVDRYRAEHPDFDAACHEARMYAAEGYEEELIEQARRTGNPVGLIVRLKQLKPLEYIERNLSMSVEVKTEVSGELGAQLIRTMLPDMTPATQAILEGRVIEGTSEDVTP